MKPRTRIPRASKKVIAANGGKMPYSSIPASSKKPRRKPRKPSEFARIYHSKQRVEFVKSLPCAACGVVGYSENAHIETGGMGRKADFDKIVPLCGNRPDPILGRDILGCHGMLHNLGRSVLEFAYGLDFALAAKKCEEQWLEFSGGEK